MANFERIELVDELHARPFMKMTAGSQIGFVVLKETREEADESLRAICSNFGILKPDTSKNFFRADIDDLTFKWERHSEFSSFMLYKPRADTQDFDAKIFELLPPDWLKKQSDQILTSGIIEIPREEKAGLKIEAVIEGWENCFQRESLAIALVLGGDALIACDSQLDQNQHIRYLIIPFEGIGGHRIGRIAQRLIEIETYKTASLLGLSVAKNANLALAEFETRMSELTIELTNDNQELQQLLNELTNLSADAEQLLSASTFRFSASGAYSDIVHNRVDILREERFAGRQLFSEFLLRRYTPSMRTIASTWERLREFSQRVERAANLLRTRVDVANAKSQQDLLASMNERAETQLKLQETVEGFSVVAITYYAISLLGYVIAPIAKWLHIEKTILIALAVVPMLIIVYKFVHGIKSKLVRH